MGCGTRQEPWHGAAKLFCRRDQAFFWRTTGDCLLSGSRQPCLQSRNRRDAMAGVCPGCLRATGGRAVASGGSSPNFIWPQHGAPSARTLPYSAVLCPYSPAFPISPVLPRLLLCSPVVWWPCPADASFYGLPGTSAALFRRSAQAREQARQAQTGTDRRKQARQVRTGADRRRQARFEVKPFRDRVFDVSVGAR